MMKERLTEWFDKIFADHDTAVARDLKLNFKKLVDDSALSEDEALLLTLATSTAVNLEQLREVSRVILLEGGSSAAEVREAEESAAIMGMLNVYYRFRHFVDHEGDAGYGPAKLRMQSLANPALGKRRFEMLALAVSAINGCEKCVTSHEKALLQLDVTKDQIHDLIRLASVVAGLRHLVT